MRFLSGMLLPAAVAVAAACGSSSPGSESANDHPASGAECNAPATLAAAGLANRNHPILVGSAVEYLPLVNDPVYAAVAGSEFDLLVPSFELKWGMVQTEPGVWNFDQPDAIYEFARRHHQQVKAHCLVWDQTLPPFVNDDLSAEELDAALAAHIAKVVGRYRGRTYAWDVVNEAVADDGSLADTVFLRKLGPGYIETAFRRARAADPRALLIYNDDLADVINPKSDGILALVTDLKRRGVPIDGVGFQMHVYSADAAPTKEELEANFERFTRLGLQVFVTELDVLVAKVPGSLARKLAFEKAIYNRIAAACAETRGCNAITTWGFTDNYSWLYGLYTGFDWPLLFDGNYQKKPAYDGELLGLVDQAVPSPGDMFNLVANPGFESGLDGWTSWGGKLAVTTAAAHLGARSAVHSRRTASWQGPVYPLTGLVAQGSAYTASAWARIATAAPVTLTAKIVCDGAVQYVNLASKPGVPGKWAFLSGTLTVPRCAALAELDLYVNGPPAGVDLGVDDVFVGNERPAHGEELVANADFETGVDGWTTWSGAMAASTQQAHGGYRSLAATERTDTWQGPVYPVGTLMSPGRTYAVNAWARLGAGGPQAVNFSAEVTCDGAQSYGLMATGLATSTGWTALTGTFIVPPCTGEFGGVNVYLEGPSAGTDLHVDDVFVKEVVADNLIGNPGFEQGVAGWSTWGAGLLASALHAHSGAHGGLVTGRTEAWMGAVYTLTPLVAQGRTYDASIWAMIGDGGDQPVDLVAVANCDGVDSYEWIGGATANSSTWTQISGTFTVPVCAWWLGSFAVYAASPDPGVDLFVDDAVVR